MASDPTSNTRISEQGNTFSAEQIQGFILAALAHEAVVDEVNDLLFKHVVERKLHPSVVTESLHPIIKEILEAATYEDWTAVTRQLTDEARASFATEATAVPR
jgi:hypothetical protein